MAMERKWDAIPSQLFTADGTTDGVLETSGADLFKVGQIVTLQSNTLNGEQFQVKKVQSPNLVTLGAKGKGINDRSDLSVYTVADGASIKACEQLRSTIAEKDMERATYQVDPVVARRVVNVDRFGEMVNPPSAEVQAQVLAALDAICTKLENQQGGGGSDNDEIRVADETISAVKLVRATSPTNVELATSDTVYEDARVLGISISAANAGNNLEIITFGKVSDSSFNFPVNDPLYLGLNGEITNIPPTTGFLTEIGMSLGSGQIFIDINDPIML